jgi:hypothetical protein
MRKVELHNCDPNGDPAPSFATDAEIEFAEQLRCRFEERFLAPTSTPAPLHEPSSEHH